MPISVAKWLNFVGGFILLIVFGGLALDIVYCFVFDPDRLIGAGGGFDTFLAFIADLLLTTAGFLMVRANWRPWLGRRL
jgi:hypothetical protein